MTAWTVDLHSGLVIELHDEAVVVGLLPAQVGAGRRGQPEQVVVALQVAGKEEVGAEGGDVLRQVPNGDMEVPAQDPGQGESQAGTGGVENGKTSLPPGATRQVASPTLRSPAHLEGLRQAGVQVEVVTEHVAGSVALPVQDAVADVVGHADGHQWELLQDRHLAGQPPQLPAGLHGDEGGPSALLLGWGGQSSWGPAWGSGSGRAAPTLTL